MLKKQDFLKPASIRLTFIPPTNDSYYLTLGPSVKDDASISINNKAFAQSSNYRDTVVINLAHQQKGQPVTITFRLKKMNVWLQNVSVYRLKQRSFNASLQTLKQSPLKISHHSSNSITGTVDLKRQQRVLMTTIPAARGWHAIVDGRPTATKTVLGTFMAIPLAPGHHQVKLYYRPPFLILGLFTSLLTISGTWLVLRSQARRQTRRRTGTDKPSTD